MPSILSLFGQNVRFRRQSLGFTQAELAARADIDRAYISNIEQGRKNISLTTLQKLADSLEVEPAQLLFADTEQNS